MNKYMYHNIVAVTNRHLVKGDFLEQVERVCNMHPKALIVRERDLTEEEYVNLASHCMNICKKYNVSCILHFYPETTRILGCRNIHLPLWKLDELASAHLKWSEKPSASDDSIHNIYDSGHEISAGQLGFDKIGVSVHSVREALHAQALGASYVIFGHVYKTDCKKGMPPKGLNALREVCERMPIPVYGIGGIGPNELQIEEVLAQGAAGVCIMSGMMHLSAE